MRQDKVTLTKKRVEKEAGHGRKSYFKKEASMVRNGDFSRHVVMGECFKIKDIEGYLTLNNLATILMGT